MTAATPSSAAKASATPNKGAGEGAGSAALTGLALLRSPFPDHQISKLPKETGRQAQERKKAQDAGNWPAKCSICGGFHHAKAVHLDYVGHAALTDRLLDCDPEWSWEPVGFGADGLPAIDRNGGLWIRLTVCGMTRLGYGSADGKTGGDAVKELIGDALRNAAMRFGAALDLWHKGDLHGSDDASDTAKAEEPKAPTLNDRADMFVGALNKAASRVDLEAAWAKGSKVCAALSTADPDKLAALTKLYETRRAAFTGGGTPFDMDEAA